MVALITGISGLVGSAIARNFLQKGISVKALIREDSNLSLIKDIVSNIIFIEGDILDILSLENAMEDVDYVIHSAAIVSFSPSDRTKMEKVNIEGTANVVNVCLSRKVKKLCFVSSISTLGRPSKIEDIFNFEVKIDERQKWVESDLNSHYAKTKYLAEAEVWRGEAEGLKIVVVNPTIVLGEGDWFKSSTKIFKYVYDEKPFYTSGYLNYVDVADLAEIVERLTVSEISGERFAITSGSVSYKDFFEKIAKRFNKKPPYFLIKPWLMAIIWRFEAMKYWLFGTFPLITKETAKTSSMRIIYSGNKISNTLNFKFKDLDQTLERVCTHLLKLNS